MKKLLILVVLFNTACITDKKRAEICATCPIVTEVTTIKKDSSWTKEIVKHDTIYRSVSGPTLIIPGPCDSLCDKNGKLKPFYKETKKNGIKTRLYTDTLKNKLIADCSEDSLMLVNKTLIIEINRLITESESTKEILPARCERAHKDWLDKWDRPWFVISCGLILGYLIFKFRSPIFGLIRRILPK